MFDKTTKIKLKAIFVFKYIFQLFIIPVLYGFLLSLIAFFTKLFMDGFDVAVTTVFELIDFGIKMPAWCACILVGYFFDLVNILSVLPFLKLLLDCFSKNNEETKEIEFANIMPAYELQCIRQSKRFMCDTFSRKKSYEVFIYDEYKTKYRLFWNENYGDLEKADQVSQAKKLKISYLKHSKIIFRCEVTEFVE